MYLAAKQLLIKIDEIIELKEKMFELYLKNQQEKYVIFKNKLESLLYNCTINDLVTVIAICNIGRCERGHRQLADGSTEIFKIDILENEDQLLEKHSKYLRYKTKEELTFYILRNSAVHQNLFEGKLILNF